MSMRIYLSGPMTGLPDYNLPAFHAAASKLRACGHTVASPAEINASTDGEWRAYLREDIKALVDCDALALLPGWQHSSGAHLELHIAHRLGLEIGLLDDFTAQRLVSQPTPSNHTSVHSDPTGVD